MNRGKRDPHLRSDLREKVIAFVFGFVKTTSDDGETELRHATTLVGVDADLFFVKATSISGKKQLTALPLD